MAIETYPAHSQQRAIVDLETNADYCVASFGTSDSNDCIRVAQIIQSGPNREGNPLKYCRIGWLSELGRKLLVFQDFFDLFRREETRARILHFG